tara:strand:- start:101 stop:964 length:864 start_codon:yes stop_codon:yes gene_type:complete
MIIWLASYPKSGNTWLRFFIISLLMGRKTNLNLNHLKAIGAYPEKSQFKGLLSNFLDLDQVAENWISSQNRINQQNDSLRFLKTHNIFGKFKNHPFTDGKNTLASIHIVRDPRNVITSIKNHFNMAEYNDAKKFLFKKGQVLTLSEKEKEKFINRDKHSLPQIIGSWKTHYLSWKSMKKNYLLIKYENLIKNPEDEFTKVANFLGKLFKNNFRKEVIDDAIKLSSFDKLEKMEQEHGFVESATNQDGTKQKFFYLGAKNNWRKMLNKKLIEEINIEFENEMKELGYL